MTASTLNNLGRVLITLGDPTSARPLLERALYIVETAYGSSHPATLAYRQTLRQLDQSTGEDVSTQRRGGGAVLNTASK